MRCKARKNWDKRAIPFLFLLRHSLYTRATLPPRSNVIMTPFKTCWSIPTSASSYLVRLRKTPELYAGQIYSAKLIVQLQTVALIGSHEVRIDRRRGVSDFVVKALWY